MEIVFTQLTKTGGFTAGSCRDHVADFDIAIGDHDAIDQKLTKVRFCSNVALAKPIRIRWQNASLDVTTDIPHRGPDFGEFLSVKPRIPISQKLVKQVQVLLREVEDDVRLSRDTQDVNPDKEVFQSC